MKLSVIIPAYNEEIELPQCLRLVKEAFAVLESENPNLTWELIVADNNSTDSTASIAKGAGATVVFEPINQIARARNAGASAATGEWFLFIDADSILHLDSVREMLEAIESGEVGGGGCLVRMDDAPRWGKFGIGIWNTLSRTMKWAAGSFVYCRGEAFHAVGGFDQQYYAAEELYFSNAMKKWCREQKLEFRVLRRQPHASSSRKFRIYSGREIVQLFGRICLSYGSTVRSQKALDFFYDGRR